jgi:hypothetical protein
MSPSDSPQFTASAPNPVPAPAPALAGPPGPPPSPPPSHTFTFATSAAPINNRAPNIDEESGENLFPPGHVMDGVKKLKDASWLAKLAMKEGQFREFACVSIMKLSLINDNRFALFGLAGLLAGFGCIQSFFVCSFRRSSKKISRFFSCLFFFFFLAHQRC